MKKLRDFISKGEPAATVPQEDGSVAEPSQPLSSQLHPADLPRDRGMAGAVGAYEVKPLTHFVAKALSELEADVAASQDGAAEVTALLDRLMPPAERHRLTLETISENVITLSLAQARDRFYYNRAIVPKLIAALRPSFGAVRVQLVDRVR